MDLFEPFEVWFQETTEACDSFSGRVSCKSHERKDTPEKFNEKKNGTDTSMSHYHYTVLHFEFSKDFSIFA